MTILTRGRVMAIVFALPLMMLPAVAPVAADPSQMAADCLDPSPTVAAGKDPYAPIAPRLLSREEHNTVRELLQSLDGEWRGSAESLRCLDDNDPADNRRYAFTVQAEVEADRYGNFFLKKVLYSPERRSTRQETLRLYLTENRLRINTPSAAGDVELIEVAANRLAFLYRLLLSNDSGRGSIRREIFVVLASDGHLFSIEQRIYTQGRLSSGKWQRFTRP